MSFWKPHPGARYCAQGPRHHSLRSVGRSEASPPGGAKEGAHGRLAAPSPSIHRLEHRGNPAPKAIGFVGEVLKRVREFGKLPNRERSPMERTAAPPCEGRVSGCFPKVTSVNGPIAVHQCSASAAGPFSQFHHQLPVLVQRVLGDIGDPLQLDAGRIARDEMRADSNSLRVDPTNRISLIMRSREPAPTGIRPIWRSSSSLGIGLGTFWT
jgi:hypothetical protein